MTPRPICHGKSFWFGLLILLFLVWAWDRSARHWDDFSIGIGSSGGGVYVQHYRGAVVAGVSGSEWLPAGISFSSTPLAEEAGRFRSGVKLRTESGLVSVECAHWMLVTLFLLAWSAWLAWRRRGVGPR